jgi:hypothetical protein
MYIIGSSCEKHKKMAKTIRGVCPSADVAGAIFVDKQLHSVHKKNETAVSVRP